MVIMGLGRTGIILPHSSQRKMCVMMINNHSEMHATIDPVRRIIKLLSIPRSVSLYLPLSLPLSPLSAIAVNTSVIFIIIIYKRFQCLAVRNDRGELQTK